MTNSIRLAVALALFASPALAADAQPRVQLQMFQVKTVNPAGTVEQQPITVLINTTSGQGSERVCAIAPRVRDAVNGRISKETYKVDKDGKLDTAKIASDLLQPVKDAGKVENVQGVEVRMGGPKVKGAGAAAFARSGCVGAAQIGEDEEKPKKELPPKKEPKAASH